MKKIQFITLAFIFLAPLGLSAQSMTGSWLSDGKDSDGNTFENKLTFNDDGTFTVDFRNDGQVEVYGNYTMEGNTVTINEANEQSPCHGKTGVYTAKFEGNTVTVTMVKDDCEQRASDEPWTMTRM